MKTTKLKLTLTNLTLTVLLGVFAGCASKGYDKGADTAAALQSSADKITETSTRVTDTLGALNDLTFKSQGDLRDQFDTFSSSVKKLDSTTADLDDEIATMRNKAQAYMDSWDSQMTNIQNADLRQRSAERKDEVTTKLKSVGDSYDGVKSSFQSFTQDLKDIQTYLGTDLTTSGVASIKDVVAKTKRDAVPLRDSIKKLQSDFSGLSSALSPVVPAAK
jgi:hypothetical protein